MIHRLAHLFATGLGTGYSPVASGTVGTAVVGLPLFLLLSNLGTAAVLAGLLAVTVLGIPAAHYVELYVSRKDPGIVVVDEIAGYLLAMAGSPAAPVHLTTGFLIFRFFDIVKPPPLRRAENLPGGGVGVMADDLLAGVYTWICLRLLEVTVF